jgi:hypothetical protein
MLAEPELDDPVQPLLDCVNDPLTFIERAFPDISLENWQREVLQSIRDQLHENTVLDRWKAVQIAVASGNAIGKTALLSWLILWAVMTFEETLGVVTAGTESQLRVRLWGELSKWFHQLPKRLRDQFEWSATSLTNKQRPATWRADAKPWTERNTEAFSGLHNYGKRVLVTFDECSMIPDALWRATDGMLNDASTQTIWCVFGNPLRLDGRFPQCFPPSGRFHESWKSFNIDSRDVTLSNKESINEKLAYYGPDSNYARSHVYGQWPTASTTQLIPRDWVEAAAVRETWQHPAEGIILGCDVSSGHSEDVSVIYIRQGLDGRSHPPRKFPSRNPVEFAYDIAATATELGAVTINIDAGGVGEGTVAKLRELNLPAHAVYFGARNDNPDGITRCANKRAAMWCAMGQWLKAGAIPNDPELKTQLIGPEFSENAQGILLERKEDMKSRGLASPDIADALALTFALPASVSYIGSSSGGWLPGRGQVVSEYDPMSDAAMRGDPLPESQRRYCAEGWARMKPQWDNPDGWTGSDFADAQASDALRYQGASQPAPEPYIEPWPSSGAGRSLWPKLR